MATVSHSIILTSGARRACRAARGLYDPRREHDACGIGLIANINNLKSHKIIADGLSILRNLEHRGAVGADPKAGDGAGVLIQIPHAFFAGQAAAARLRAAGAPDLRRRLPVHAARAHLPPGYRAHLVGDGARGRAEGSRLARRAGRFLRPRSIGAGHRAVPPPGVHRPRADHPRRGPFRAQAVRLPQGRVEPRARGPGPTRRAPTTRYRSPRAPSSTRAWCSARIWAPITAISRTKASNRPWRWSISAFPPTPSRAGRWPIPIASSATTARSTRCAATSTGWRRARPT